MVIDPLSFDLARGKVAGNVALDGRPAIPRASLDLGIDQVALRDFFQGTRFADQMSGTLAGQVKLSGQGHSTAEILGHSDGHLALFMAGGSMSDLVVQLIGLDIAKVLGLVATKDQPVAIRCMVTSFAVDQGQAKADSMVLDTTPSAITGQGGINLGNETLDLRLTPHPKQPSLLSARSDVLVQGTFKTPKVGVDPALEAARGTAAAALGALLTPLGALLPFIDLGLGKDSPCAQLIQEAKAGGRKAD